MIKRLFYILVSALMVSAFSFACTPAPAADDSEEGDQSSVDPSSLSALVATAPVPDNNFIFDSKPQFVLNIENRNQVTVSDELTVKVLTDKKETLTTLELGKISVPASSTIEKEITLDYDFKPGFYKAQCIIQKRIARAVDFGIRPTEIVSAPDMQNDFGPGHAE